MSNKFVCSVGAVLFVVSFAMSYMLAGCAQSEPPVSDLIWLNTITISSTGDNGTHVSELHFNLEDEYFSLELEENRAPLLVPTQDFRVLLGDEELPRTSYIVTHESEERYEVRFTNPIEVPQTGARITLAAVMLMEPCVNSYGDRGFRATTTDSRSTSDCWMD